MDKNKIEEVVLSRDIVVQFGAAPPHGFREEPLALSKKEENDKETAGIVENYNREKIRFVGELKLVPDTKTLISIPVKDTSNIYGSVTFIYSKKFLLGGFTSYFSVNLSDAPRR